MKQLFQQLNNGDTLILNVPTPSKQDNSILVQAKYSVISAGTERTILDFGKSSWISKVKKNPEKVKDVFSKIRSNGILETYKAVKNKLDQPIPLGYSMVAQVISNGGNDEFEEGDVVVTNSSHSEISMTNPNVCVKVPNNVNLKSAVFTPIASIGLQAINLLNLEKGSNILLIGLGLIGQITGRILVSKGYNVLGIDLSIEKCKLANKFGIDIISNNFDFTTEALSWTNGLGFDGVIVTASSPSSDIINKSAECVKKRGKIISVGVVGLNLYRPIFFSKECSIQVSCSYGSKTENGFGTAKDNFINILNLMSLGKLNLEDLITFEFDFENASNAYNKLFDPNIFGILLKYNDLNTDAFKTSINLIKYTSNSIINIGIIGAGNFTSRTLLPIITSLKYKVNTISSHQGYNALFLANKFSIATATTSEEEILYSGDINTIFITTRHDTHFYFAKLALSSDKYLWVEKPLCINLKQLNELRELFKNTNKLMVGFNRRFSPISLILKTKLENIYEPYKINMTINAGKLPVDHWILNPQIGGGRIIGEVCHFIDLALFFVQQQVKSIKCNFHNIDGQDGSSFTLFFENGVIVDINYITDLPKHIPKEQIEFTGNNWNAKINNWTYLITNGLDGAKFGNLILASSEKGHKEALKAFFSSVTNNIKTPIDFEEIYECTKISILMQDMKTNEEITLF